MVAADLTVRLGKRIISCSDSCKNGFAAILIQGSEGRHVLISIISRVKAVPEKSYSSVTLENIYQEWEARKWSRNGSEVYLVR